MVDGLFDWAGAVRRLVRQPAGSVRLLQDAAQRLSLLVEHVADRLASQHDALECVGVDLVELPRPTGRSAGRASSAAVIFWIAGPSAWAEAGRSSGNVVSTVGKKLVASSVATCVSGCIMY